MRRPGIIAVVLLGLLACRHRPGSPAPGSVTAVDDLGNAVTLPQFARHIVSMAPSITETLFALGLDSAIVGVTDCCDYPPQARLKPRIGGIANPSLEQVTALQPDLIVMSVAGNIRGDYEKLRSVGFTVFVTNPTTVEGVFKSIEDLGALTGNRERATGLTLRLRARFDSLRTLAHRFQARSVLLLISLHPLVAVAPQTFLGQLIVHANGRNVIEAASTQYPMLSREEILRRPPEVLLVTNDIAHTAEEVMGMYPEWKALVPAKVKAIRLVDANLIARPGPRLVDGLAQLIEAIHVYEK